MPREYWPDDGGSWREVEQRHGFGGDYWVTLRRGIPDESVPAAAKAKWAARQKRDQRERG